MSLLSATARNRMGDAMPLPETGPLWLIFFAAFASELRDDRARGVRGLEVGVLVAAFATGEEVCFCEGLLFVGDFNFLAA